MQHLIVLAPSFHAFDYFLRRFKLNPKAVTYANGGFAQVHGRSRDTQVMLMDGYQYNLNYSTEFMVRLSRRFENIHFVTERELFFDKYFII